LVRRQNHRTHRTSQSDSFVAAIFSSGGGGADRNPCKAKHHHCKPSTAWMCTQVISNTALDVMPDGVQRTRYSTIRSYVGYIRPCHANAVILCNAKRGAWWLQSKGLLQSHNPNQNGIRSYRQMERNLAIQVSQQDHTRVMKALSYNS